MTPTFDELKILTAHGFTRLAYAEWGARHATRTVLCVHGLTRNSRDFDPLAEALAGRGWRVIAPDMPGRGRSAWLATPEDYGYPLYLAAAAALYARLESDTIAWVGTSMGGLIGMMLAAQGETPITRLVVNDIGPFIPKAALARIGAYVGADPRFANLDEAEAYLRRVHAPFGPLSDQQWRHLAVHSAVPAEPGRLKLHYDPTIALPFTQKEPTDVDLWPVWDQITCPILALRGASSDLLLPETAAEMTRRGRAVTSGLVRLIEIDGCGHAPALMDDKQIALVADFLDQG